MKFLVPIAFAFAATIPLVILLYLLKLKRVELIISSTYLWKKSIEDLTANAPFQRLRKNLLLLLQILILAALVFALVRPFMPIRRRENHNLILLVDHSASMQSRDVSPSRLERAKTIATQMINDLGDDDRMMIISFADVASMKTNFTEDKVHLKRLVAGIPAVDCPTKIAEALSVAESFAKGKKNPEIIIISDGAISDIADARKVSVPVKYISVSGRRRNVAITEMSVRRGIENTEEVYTFVRAANFTEKPLDTIVSLYLNRELIDAQEVKIPPGEGAPVLFGHTGLSEGILRGQIDVDDDFPLDNRAWKVISQEATIEVLLVVSGRAPFLEKALYLDPFVKLSRVAPKDYTPSLKADVIIFDSVNPEKIGPGKYLFINCLPPFEGVKTEGFVENPFIISWKRDHPAMLHLNLGNLRIAKAMNVTLPSWATALAEARQGPMIADLSMTDSKVLATLFATSDSNWPLRISFPLFVSNALRWLSEQKLRLMDVDLAAGEALPLAPSVGSLEATVTTPSGRVRTVALQPGTTSYFSDTREAGIYGVKWASTPAGLPDEQYFSVNLLNETESNTSPVEAIEIEGEKSVGVAGPVMFNREIWDYFALAAFCVLLLEWYIYTRRAWV